MSAERPRFSEYGEGGDYIGARRARRAFRYFVAAVLLFTLALAFAELYLKQEGAERLYTLALTLPDESARVYLKQAVLQDRQTHETPTPKYLQALAAREEAPFVLERYEEAFAADNTNSSLALRYGCQLLKAGRPEEAAAKFEVAVAGNPLNALPLYLKAAAQPGLDTQEKLSESLALVAQTNSSGKRVSYPRPLWSSELPPRGRIYAELCRRTVDECTAPLYTYADQIVRLARSRIEAGQTQYWDSWLQTLQQMGERIAAGAVSPGQTPDGPMAGGASAAIVGSRIQLAALEQRQAIVQMGGAPPNDELIRLRAKIEAALEPLLAFENARDSRVASDRRGYLFPARLLGFTLLVLLLVYVAARLAWSHWGRRMPTVPPTAIEPAEARPERVEAGEESEWTVRHSNAARVVLVTGGLFLLTTLFLVMFLQRSATPAGAWAPFIGVAWSGQLGAMLAFGVLYPYLLLPRARDAARRHGASPEEAEDILPTAQRLRRRAAICLVYRYYGVLLGVVLIVFCVWVLGYRVMSGLYPWQTPLLTTGLIGEEAAVVQQALSLLR